MVGCQREKWLGNASAGEETAFSASGDVGRDGWTYKPSRHNKWIKFWITEKLHLLVVALYGHCLGIQPFVKELLDWGLVTIFYLLTKVKICIQKIVVSSWSMEQWVVDTVPEKKDAFLSGLEFKGEVATSVRYFNTTHLRQAYLGRREIVTNGNVAHIFSWLIILKFDQFPKKQNTQSRSKDSQETKAFLKRKEVWCILTPKKMMLPIHISC